MAKPAPGGMKGRDLQPGHEVKYTGYWYRIQYFTGAGVVDNELSPDLGADYRTAWGRAVNGRPKVLILRDAEDYVVRAAEQLRPGHGAARRLHRGRPASISRAPDPGRVSHADLPD